MSKTYTVTIPPTGLSITRSGAAFTFAWKIGDADYGAGELFRYSVNWGPWAQVGIGAGATSLTLTLGNVVQVAFQVMGKRKAYTKKKKTYEPIWSDWAGGEWIATPPNMPSITYERTAQTSGTFSWSIPDDGASTAVFTGAVVETCTTRGVSPKGWVNVGQSGASGSAHYDETLGGANLIRWFRAKAVGVGGMESAWAYSSHCYGNPTKADLLSASAALYGSATRITAQWNAFSPANAPVDTVEVQYAIDVPTDVDFTAPASGWSEAMKLNSNGHGDMVVANVSDQPGPDECVWVRIQTTHDEENHDWSDPKLAYIGKLQAPDIEATPDGTGDVDIEIDENTSCTVACTAIYYRPERNPEMEIPVAVLPNGTTSVTINIPEIDPVAPDPDHTCFGAYAFVGIYDGTSVTAKMVSDKAEDTDLVSRPPEWLQLSNGSQNNSVRITWPWTWKDATSAELAWADHDDAWESTAEPSYYKVENRRVESWVIAGLELGKRWYFQARLLYEGDDENVTGPWSQQYSFDLSSIPDRPSLTLSKGVINEGDSVTARWGYTSEDGTTQAYADICLASYDSNNQIVYGDIIAHVETGQSVELVYDWQTDETYFFCVRTTSTSGRQSEWSEPASLFVAPPIEIAVTQMGLALRFTAEDWLCTLTGQIYSFEEAQTLDTYQTDMVYILSLKINNTTIDPDAYSVDPASGIITFNPAITVAANDYMQIEGYVPTDDHSITQSSVMWTAENAAKYQVGSKFVVVKGVVVEYYLREVQRVWLRLEHLPIAATVTGAGDNGITTAAIVRAEDYHIYRPDDSEIDGYAGEQIVAKSQVGESQMTITYDDLVGHLDEGAKYIIRFTVQDEYGQTASTEYRFRVNWAHSAGIPTATVKADKYQRMVMITPTAPMNYATGDVCDIYRITMDKPELIVKGGAFGTAYVDPYPGFGDVCGHRVVTRTKNGDYITSGNQLAWVNLDEDDGDILEDQSMVIDVQGDQIELPYNLEFSNTWKKDFQRTAYLGGSIQGDWNPAVTRDMSANTVIIAGPDVDRQLSMRSLAGYAGPAHVRTPDGSSFACDIQVRENMDYKSSKVTYSLTIQAIDPQAPEGMTLDQWQAMHPVS